MNAFPMRYLRGTVISLTTVMLTPTVPTQKDPSTAHVLMGILVTESIVSVSSVSGER